MDSIPPMGKRLLRWLGFMVLVGGMRAKRAEATNLLEEGGENGLGNVSIHVSAGYNVLSNSIYADPPPHSFHSAHPD